jgi:hypothetical protein
MAFRTFNVPLVVASVVMAVALAAGVASAHEQRTVGEYDVEVGFFEEPALVNQLNGVFLEVSREGEPIEGLDDTLKVELIVGGGAETKEMAFEPSGDPGAYVISSFPRWPATTRSASSVTSRTLQVDESESGPGGSTPWNRLTRSRSRNRRRQCLTGADGASAAKRSTAWKAGTLRQHGARWGSPVSWWGWPDWQAAGSRR